jgi:hypothetical protein
MNLKALLMEKNPSYNGSMSCLISSQGFLLAALYQGIVQYNYVISALLVPVWLVSTWYHSSGRGRKVDTALSSVFFSVFLLYLWVRGDHLAVALGLLAIFGYFSRKGSSSKGEIQTFEDHCLCVHLPAILGLFMIAPSKKNKF